MLEMLPPCQDTESPCQETERLYEELLSLHDLQLRAIRNPNMPQSDRLLYLALVETYPTIALGRPTAVSVWEMRKHAGWVSSSAASKFLAAMVAIGAITYDPGQYDPEEGTREGIITANLDIFLYPENFNTKDTEKRKKARQDAQKHRESLLVHNCEECGSSQIRYELLPKCGSCGHVHPAMEVQASQVTITPLEDDFMSDFVAPTELGEIPFPAPPDPETPLPVVPDVVYLPETPSPVAPADPETPWPEVATLDPPERCTRCGGKDFHLALSRDRWLCLDCGKPYPLYAGSEMLIYDRY